MIEQGLFKRHFVGRDGFHWWIGQIPDFKTWKDNKAGKRTKSNEEIQGFGERFKVRIMGYHTADPQELPDEELPWASVMYPVTAGGGGKGATQTANLSAGTFVYGFFLDGEDAQQPIIMGAIGYNEYQEVMKNVTPAGFKPFIGYEPSETIPFGQERARNAGGGGQTIPQSQQGGQPVNDNLIVGSTLQIAMLDELTEDAKEENEEPIAQPTSCEPIPVGRIQQQIQNVIKEVERLQKNIYRYQVGTDGVVTDITGKINEKMQKVAKFMAAQMKWIFTQIEQFTIGKITEALKFVYNIAMPNERNAVKQTSNTILDTIACFFRKIISKLTEMCMSFLQESIDRVINVSESFVNNFVGDSIGSLGNTIDGMFQGLDGIISSSSGMSSGLQDALGSIGGGGGSGGGGGGMGMQIVNDILSFLKCDDNPECTTVPKWNILSGPSNMMQSNFAAISRSSRASSSNSTRAGGDNPDNTGFAALENFSGGIENYNFNQTFTNSKDIGPIPCGPPTIEIISKNGVGAEANLIIGPNNEIIAVDMVSYGQGYDANTIVQAVDACGKGNGAVLKPILGSVPRAESYSGTGGVDGRGFINPASKVINPKRIGFGPFGVTDYEYNISNFPPTTLAPGSFVPSLNQDDGTAFGGGGLSEIPITTRDTTFTNVTFKLTREAALSNRIEFQASERPTQGTGVVNFTYTGDDAPGTFLEEIIEDIDYIVVAYLPNGKPMPNPIKIFDNGSTIAIDDEYGERWETQTFEKVKDGIEPVTFEVLREADFDTVITFQRTEGTEGDEFLIFDNRIATQDTGRKFEGRRIRRGTVTYNIKRGSRYTLTRVSDPNTNTDRPHDLWVDGNTLKLEDLVDVDFNDVLVTPQDGTFVNKNTFDFEIVTEVVTEEVFIPAMSDLDYDDIVINASKGKFFDVQGHVCKFRVSTDREEGGSGTGTTITTPPTFIPGPGITTTVPTTGPEVGIVDIVIIDPGAGYLPNPDGSEGGGDRTWKEPDETVIKREDGKWEVPIPPDNYVCVLPGDEVTLPPGTSVITENNSGEGGGEVILGGSSQIVNNPGCFTTPTPGVGAGAGDGDGGGGAPGIGTGTGGTGAGGIGDGGAPGIGTGFPGVGDGGALPGVGAGGDGNNVTPGQDIGIGGSGDGNADYGIVLDLDEIVILNPGFNYSPDDTLYIAPPFDDDGNVINNQEPQGTFELDNLGRVRKVTVTRGACGYTSLPEVYIISETGYNAELVSKLIIDGRCTADPTFEDRIVKVIDCVGKLNV